MFGKKRKSPSRNLADQNSKRVYSYYSNTRLRSDEQPGRSRQDNATKRQFNGLRWWHHAPSILALSAILICLGYILSVNTNPKIVQVSDSHSLFLRDKNTYQAAANKIINKSLLNYNKVTFNINGISSELKQEFPELSNVSITMPIVNRRPVIYLTTSKLAVVLVTEDQSMVVDSRGVAIVSASQVSNLSKYNLPTVYDKSGLRLTTGSLILPGSSVKFILDIYQQFKAASQPIDQLTLPAVANELDVKLAGQQYFIKMDLLGDSREEAGAFLAAQAKINSLHAQPSKYVDVRVVGRVYYK